MTGTAFDVRGPSSPQARPQRRPRLPRRNREASWLPRAGPTAAFRPTVGRPARSPFLRRVSAGRASPPTSSSRSSRASAMSWRRCARVPLQTSFEAASDCGRRLLRQGRPVGLASEDGGEDVARPSPLRRPASPSASRRGRRRTPRRPRACRRACPAPARATCRRPSRGSFPPPSPRAVSVGDCVSPRSALAPGSPLRRLREAEVEQLHPPSGDTFTFAGLRSRWTIPFSCAASSASAICRAIDSASSSGKGAGARSARRGLRRRQAP